MWNSAREAARDASLGEDTLDAVATNLLTYLQGAEPTAFGQGHSTSLISPVVSLPANTSGYTCWDNTANRELFTMSFSDLTNPSVTDPTDANQLDVYLIGISVPYASVSISPLPQITGTEPALGERRLGVDARYTRSRSRLTCRHSRVSWRGRMRP